MTPRSLLFRIALFLSITLLMTACVFQGTTSLIGGALGSVFIALFLIFTGGAQVGCEQDSEIEDNLHGGHDAPSGTDVTVGPCLSDLPPLAGMEAGITVGPCLSGSTPPFAGMEAGMQAGMQAGIQAGMQAGMQAGEERDAEVDAEIGGAETFPDMHVGPCLSMIPPDMGAAGSDVLDMGMEIDDGAPPIDMMEMEDAGMGGDEPPIMPCLSPPIPPDPESPEEKEDDDRQHGALLPSSRREVLDRILQERALPEDVIARLRHKG
jgi:hypothetical protein